MKDKIRVHTDLKFERRPRPLRKDPQIPRHIALPLLVCYSVIFLSIDSCLPSLEVDAVSQASSQESNPNSPLSVITLVI